jgi:hypothetical protein
MVGQVKYQMCYWLEYHLVRLMDSVSIIGPRINVVPTLVMSVSFTSVPSAMRCCVMRSAIVAAGNRTACMTGGGRVTYALPECRSADQQKNQSDLE